MRILIVARKGIISCMVVIKKRGKKGRGSHEFVARGEEKGEVARKKEKKKLSKKRQEGR